MVFKKIIFQNRYVALKTPSRPPPPSMANTILNFHFDYLTNSLMKKKYTCVSLQEVLQQNTPYQFPNIEVSQQGTTLQMLKSNA